MDDRQAIELTRALLEEAYEKRDWWLVDRLLDRLRSRLGLPRVSASEFSFGSLFLERIAPNEFIGVCFVCRKSVRVDLSRASRRAAHLEDDFAELWAELAENCPHAAEHLAWRPADGSPRFAKGDRVRINQDDANGAFVKAGDTGTVIAILSPYGYGVRMDKLRHGTHETWGLNSEFLEPEHAPLPETSMSQSRR